MKNRKQTRKKIELTVGNKGYVREISVQKQNRWGTQDKTAMSCQPAMRDQTSKKGKISETRPKQEEKLRKYLK